MSTPIFLIILIIMVLLFLSIMLLGYALYLRHQTDLRNQLVKSKIPKWQQIIECWLESNSYSEETPEAEAYLFLQYLTRESELLTAHKKQKLGQLIVKMGLDKYLAAVMKSGNQEMQAWAVYLLGYFGLKAYQEEIIPFLSSKSELLSFAATLTMARLLKPDESMFKEFLHMLLQKFDRWSTEKLGEVIILLGPEAGQEMIRMVKAGQAQGRLLFFLVDILGELELQEAGPLLVQLLQHKGVETRVHAIRSLGLIKFHPALPDLIEMLSNEEWVLRAQAAKVLGYFADSAVLEPLTACLKDSNWWVRQNAAQALTALGTQGKNKLRQVIDSGGEGYDIDIALLILERRDQTDGVV